MIKKERKNRVHGTTAYRKDHSIETALSAGGPGQCIYTAGDDKQVTFMISEVDGTKKETDSTGKHENAHITSGLLGTHCRLKH